MWIGLLIRTSPAPYFLYSAASRERVVSIVRRNQTHASHRRDAASGRREKYIRAQPLQFRAFQLQFALYAADQISAA